MLDKRNDIFTLHGYYTAAMLMPVETGSKPLGWGTSSGTEVLTFQLLQHTLHGPAAARASHLHVQHDVRHGVSVLQASQQSHTLSNQPVLQLLGNQPARCMGISIIAQHYDRDVS
jgi:hypothetical protein